MKLRDDTVLTGKPLVKEPNPKSKWDRVQSAKSDVCDINDVLLDKREVVE